MGGAGLLFIIEETETQRETNLRFRRCGLRVEAARPFRLLFWRLGIHT